MFVYFINIGRKKKCTLFNVCEVTSLPPPPGPNYTGQIVSSRAQFVSNCKLIFGIYEFPRNVLNILLLTFARKNIHPEMIMHLPRPILFVYLLSMIPSLVSYLLLLFLLYVSFIFFHLFLQSSTKIIIINTYSFKYYN